MMLFTLDSNNSWIAIFNLSLDQYDFYLLLDQYDLNLSWIYYE